MSAVAVPTDDVLVVRHSLSDIDNQNLVAVCSICGPTRIYVSKYRSGSINYKCSKGAQPKDLSKMHRLIQKDIEARQATCSICGPVRIYPAGRDSGWMCSKKSLETQKGQNHRRHGLNDSQFQNLWNNQDGRCPCGELLGDKYHIDHDHDCCAGIRSCGQCVRGILCSTCNVGIGMLHNDPARLRALARYLEEKAHVC